MAEKKRAKKAAAPKRGSAPSKKRKVTRTKEPRARITPEEAAAIGEAFAEAVNEGLSDPVVFMVSGDDPLGREILERKLGESDVAVPLVINAPAIRRHAMLLVIDQMLWRK